MDELLAAILSMLLVVLLIPLYLWKRRQDSRSPPHQHEDPPQVPIRDTAVRATGARRMRRRLASGASSSTAPPPLEEDADESEDEAVDGEYYEERASTKKEKKRQEREAQRQAISQPNKLHGSRGKQNKTIMLKRGGRKMRSVRHWSEEEAQAQKAKEEEAAALEFEKWKGEFSVDAEGSTENEVQDGNQDLLSNFVEYIKNHKCVPLEDLAAEFKLRTQECINRITSLESVGRLSGVMDDRGKYIYISQEEMQAVADYIKRQGRVSISHLASKSNQFIDLEPKAQFVEEISSAEEIIVS
ncbi:hypothetical protein TIFTF001_020657 [Ficus carica]|uniref:DDRGK domain-containing protein 1 n=1 Tax=Ficus carica TaxID=3494 RepID=A0AA88AIV8_FICCA|nr:hypothetical protein TIFTF001_020657 [Ficus carica]